MTLTHFLQMSLVYPRTHQLVLRLLLEEPRFAQALTGAHFEIGYVVKLEAENGIYDLGLYENGHATFFVNCKPKALRIFKVNKPAQIIEMNYEDLTGPLEVYLWNSALPHRNPTVNEQIALHYYRAIHLQYLMPPQGDSLAIN